ncbi:MAG TPA: hypothetical protein VK348_08050, partial [Planctomycetota bacterium]|nr:hypothetical protein [Planctomycetota bacterium]
QRSDGSVIAWGDNSHGQCDVPVLPSGSAYVEVKASLYHTVARLGAESSYVTFGNGCSGSLPATHIVPLDTPRIATTLRLHLDNLPMDMVFLFAGWSNTTSRYGPLPLDLGASGMPGCTLYASDDSTVFLMGSGGFADHGIPIPNNPVLVGLRFYMQAVVVDPAAGNAFGGVMSAAMTGVVGN